LASVGIGDDEGEKTGQLGAVFLVEPEVEFH